MASSKGSPGPHDRDPSRPRPKCTQKTRNGKPCSNYAEQGAARRLQANPDAEVLCRPHRLQAEALAATGEYPVPADIGSTDNQGTPTGQTRGGIKTQMSNEVAHALLVSERSRQALDRLGLLSEGEGNDSVDPKQVLLDSVTSAHRLRQLIEAMLASIPESDFADIGMSPLPGAPNTHKGARIEFLITKLEATQKSAARISKMALDAGIEERQVRIAEEQQALIADTVRAGLVVAIELLKSTGALTDAAADVAMEQALAGAAAHLNKLASGADEVQFATIDELGNPVTTDRSARPMKEVGKA